MSIFNLDGWCKLSDEAQAISLKNIRFHLNDGDEKLLAQAEVHLQITGEKRFISLLTKPDLSLCYHTNAGLYVTVDYEFISTQILNGVALT